MQLLLIFIEELMKKIVLIGLCVFGTFGFVNAGPVAAGYGYQAIFNTPTGTVYVRSASLGQCLFQQQNLRYRPGYRLISSCRATIFDI